jgi:importin subunit alpha-1
VASQVVIPALRATGNIVTGTDVQTQCVIDAGALPAFAALVRHERRNVRREACWASSNIAAGTAEQIGQLASTPNMVGNLIHQMDKGDWNVQKEAVWAISNMITSGGDAIVHYAVSCKVLKPMVRMLKVEDPKITMVAMEAITTILEAGRNPSDVASKNYVDLVEEAGGADALEALQQHANTDIYEKAVALMEAYYGGGDEEDVDENLVPAVAVGAKTFTFGSTATTTGSAVFGGFNTQCAPAPAASTGFSFGMLANTQFK